MELTSKSKVVILYANTYDMVVDSGERLSGCTVEYYFYGEHGEALKPVFDADGGALGLRRSKSTLSFAMRDKLDYVPGVYEGTFSMTVNKDGKPQLVLTDVDFCGKCIITMEGETAPVKPIDKPVDTKDAKSVK